MREKIKKVLGGSNPQLVTNSDDPHSRSKDGKKRKSLVESFDNVFTKNSGTSSSNKKKSSSSGTTSRDKNHKKDHLHSGGQSRSKDSREKETRTKPTTTTSRTSPLNALRDILSRSRSPDSPDSGASYGKGLFSAAGGGSAQQVVHNKLLAENIKSENNVEVMVNIKQEERLQTNTLVTRPGPAPLLTDPYRMNTSPISPSVLVQQGAPTPAPVSPERNNHTFQEQHSVFTDAPVVSPTCSVPEVANVLLLDSTGNNANASSPEDHNDKGVVNNLRPTSNTGPLKIETEATSTVQLTEAANPIPSPGNQKSDNDIFEITGGTEAAFQNQLQQLQDKLPGMLEKMENAKNHNPVGAKGLFGSLHFDKGNKIEGNISGNTNEGDRSSSSQENNYSGVDNFTGRSKGPTISKVIKEIQHVDVTGTGLGMNKAAAPVVAASSRTTPSSNTSNTKPATSSSGTIANSLMKNLIPRIPSKLRVSPRASKEIRKDDQEDFEIGLEHGVSGDAAVVDDDKHQLEEQMNEKEDNVGDTTKLTSQSRSSTSKEYSNNGEESGTGTKSEESIAKIRRADSVDFVNFYLNETTQIGINSGRQHGGRGQHHHEDHRAARGHHDDHMKIETNAAVSRRSSGVFSTGELSVRTGEGDEDDISSPGTPRVVAEDRKKVEDDRARRKEEELLGKMEQMLESKLELVMQKQMEALLLAQGKMMQTAQPQPHLQEPGFAAQQLHQVQQPPERNDKPASSLGGSSERSLMVSVPIRGSRDTEDS
ncbi:unnamed protein product [Amoebophrya sp. A120]|nr:unnamed protein product [Amoebophrya sp. A120]|eukprot:GSA120T00009047001.1